MAHYHTLVLHEVAHWICHLKRGDMLTSEQDRCSNEKKISAQSLNANPLNWLLTRTTGGRCRSSYGCWPFHNDKMGQQLCDERQGKTPKASLITPEQSKYVSWGKSYNELKWRMKYKKGYRALDVWLPKQFSIIGNSERIILWSHSAMC